MSDIIIFGNASIARLAYLEITDRTEHNVKGFTVDKDYIEQDSLFKLPVVPFDEVSVAFKPEKYKMFIAAGYVQVNKIRAQKYEHAKEIGYKFINIISMKSTIYSDLVVGENVFISHNSVIYNDVKIGNNVFIGAGCTIAHDVVIRDNCFFADGVAVSGYVNIGEKCFFGTNSTIRNRVDIGNECVIGAGANILEDTEDRSVYLGEPSKSLPIKSDQLPVE